MPVTIILEVNLVLKEKGKLRTILQKRESRLLHKGRWH